MYGDINNKRIKYNPTELRAQSVDRARHGQSLKWKCERVTERSTENNNKGMENNGNMKERQRLNVLRLQIINKIIDSCSFVCSCFDELLGQ